MKQLIPAGHRVLVKPDAVEDSLMPDELRKMGFKLADADNSRKNAVISGEIVAIGKTAWKAFDDGEPWAEIGDKVFFAKYGGFVIEHPETGEKFRLLNDEDITVVVR
jgi:co-chaperonin GroES (HSP10)